MNGGNQANMKAGAGQPLDLADLGRRLDERIDAAIERGDWEQAAGLCDGLAGELSNASMARLLRSMLAALQPRLDADQAGMAGQIRAAVADRDADRVRALLTAKTERHRQSHDVYTQTMARLMSTMVDLLGADGLEEILREVGEDNRGMFEPNAVAGARAQVEGFSKALRAHLGTIRVTEDEDRFTITQDPCGSGGRLMRAGMFDGEHALRRVSSDGALTVGRENFPSYCTHCPVWLGQQHLEWFGLPLVHEPPRTNGDPCVQHIYKRADRVPTDYRDLVGRRAAKRAGSERNPGT